MSIRSESMRSRSLGEIYVRFYINPPENYRYELIRITLILIMLVIVITGIILDRHLIVLR